MTIDKTTVKNILIIRKNNIGDMVCAIPILKSIRREFPQAHITVLADRTNAGIVNGASYIDKLLVYRKGQGIYKNKYLCHRQLFRQNKTEYDIAIALKIGFSSALSLITLISGAKIRIGCIPERWHPLQFCYNFPIKGYKRWKSMPQIDAFFSFIHTAGIKTTIKDISIEIDSGARERAEGFLQKNILNTERRTVVFNISNNNPENTWPIERFRETVEMVSELYKATYIITATPPDQDKALNLLKHVDADIFFFETPKVMDFAALAAKADLLICGEGGAMHIGAGVNTPTISLWGKFRPVKWIPYGEKQFVIKKGEHVSSISADDVLEIIEKNNLLK
jgi:ADP-heptose:LPS heptosyltransferase